MRGRHMTQGGASPLAQGCDLFRSAGGGMERSGVLLAAECGACLPLVCCGGPQLKLAAPCVSPRNPGAVSTKDQSPVFQPRDRISKTYRVLKGC